MLKALLHFANKGRPFVSCPHATITHWLDGCRHSIESSLDLAGAVWSSFGPQLGTRLPFAGSCTYMEEGGFDISSLDSCILKSPHWVMVRNTRLTWFPKPWWSVRDFQDSSPNVAAGAPFSRGECGNLYFETGW